MKIKVDEIHPRVILLKFESQYEIASTMMMLQEYYESPYENIFHKIVSYEEYMDTYAKHTGNFTYFTDWNGFNVPGDIVVQYRRWKIISQELWEKERLLFKILDRYIKKYGENFYILAIHIDTDIQHELAHAFYYLNKEYKEEADKIINKRLKYFKDKRKKLLKMGYREDMIDDEQQAYFLESKQIDFKLIELQKKAKELFRRCTNGELK